MEECALEPDGTFICVYSQAFVLSLCALYQMHCRFLNTPRQVREQKGVSHLSPALRTKHSFSIAAPLPDCQRNLEKQQVLFSEMAVLSAAK